MRESVLLLDDDATMLSILEGVLSGAGYACVTASDALEALALIESQPDIAVVISDILMPGVTGLQFVGRLNALPLERAPPRVVLLTGQPTLEQAVDALRLGVRDFLVKPIRASELTEAVGRALAQIREDRSSRQMRPPDVERLLHQAEELVGRLRGLAYTAESGLAAPDDARAVATAGQAPAGVSARPRADPGDSGKLAILDTIEQLRRLRGRYLHHHLDDVAWDLLLELLRAERMRQRLSVSGLAISIMGVSTTTSLRRVNELVARDYIERIPDPADARRDFVTLTPRSRALLSDYLAQANTHLSAVTGAAPA